MSKKLQNEIGAIPLLILLAVVGLIIFLIISQTAVFQNKLFSLLYPKPISEASTNLIKNPGCETDALNWTSYQGSVSRITSTFRSGLASCQISYSGAGGFYTIDDAPTSVLNPSIGSTYTAEAWVKSSNALGKSAKIVIRQRGGLLAERTTPSLPLSLTNEWQKIPAATTTVDVGRTELEVYISQSSALAGDMMQIDDINLYLNTPAATPTPTPLNSSTPSPTASPSPTTTPTIDVTTANKQTYAGQLFSSTSEWNTPIPSNAQVDPNSGVMINNFLKNSAKGIYINGNSVFPDYGVPLYYANSSTPKVKVLSKYGWFDATKFTSVPMPIEARPAVGDDHHLSIWDLSTNTLYEYWEMAKNSDGTWSAGSGVVFSSTGNGYNTGIWQLGSRAYGGSLISGVIRYQEMKSKSIKHALAIGYSKTRGKYYARGLGKDGITMNIAAHNDNNTSSDRQGVENIPEGARLRLKQSVDVNAKCGTNAACITIGNAFKTYGVFMVDTSSSPAIFAEVLTDKSVSWNGILAEADARAFSPNDFEVLSLPQTLTSSDLR